MKFFLSENQLKRIIENSVVDHNKIFAEKFYEKYGRIPTYKTLESSSNIKVGEIYPEHPKANVNLKTFVNKYFSNLNDILNELTEKYNIVPNRYVSIDKKHRFRSLFESILYNVFVLEGKSSELVYEPKELLRKCSKLPDFLWEKENTIIEIAGMEDEKYFKRLEKGTKCFENEGYKVVVFEVRNLEKSHKYLEFYEKICEVFGFNKSQDIIDSPSKIIDFVNVDKKYMMEYVDLYINKFDRTRGETDMLDKFLKILGYRGIKDYKNKIGLPRFQSSVSSDRIIELVKQKKKYEDIANELGISKNTVIERIRKAKEQGLLPKDVVNWEERSLEKRKVKERPSLDQLKKDFEELNSWEKVGQKYKVSSNSIRKWIKGYEKPEDTNLLESEKKGIVKSLEDILTKNFSEDKYICKIEVTKDENFIDVWLKISEQKVEHLDSLGKVLIARAAKAKISQFLSSNFKNLDFDINTYITKC